MVERPYTPAMAAALRRLQFDPAAVLSYEGLSGGLVWSDEWSPELQRACSQAPPEVKYVCRFLWAYRASLIKGSPDPRWEDLWQTMRADFPCWPMFQRSRCTPELQGELERRGRAFLDELEDVFGNCPPKGS